ncbi:hypothetical protein Poli38472_011511 [Pythium oligandrum]|uniref:RING-type domain-containing protein n=1 Tax=Pythium oligandrum TaxID=41045 RepID=A0A8K1CKZ1_PYTOL|nr:hypothetical protein Poli38472_011511 [Pythium oligandrum]|eukprot:TMW64631.1 hypothetical protein Poli38472_011511 [Pythium oligandrum]
MASSSVIVAAPLDGPALMLPSDPQAAYALGLLRKLLLVKRAGAAAMLDEAEALTVDVLDMLEDPSVCTGDKEELIMAVELAIEVEQVREALALLRGRKSELTGDEAKEEDEDELRVSMPVSEEAQEDVVEIPTALACAICCDELMLKPASLLCGHSFCKKCLSMWLKSCPNCPSCRQPVIPRAEATSKGNRPSTGPASTKIAVNFALQDMMELLYPEKLLELEQRNQLERQDRLRELIYRSIETGQPVKELIAQEQQQTGAVGEETQVALAMLLERDAELQQQLLAAENRERLRKERALREASRQRHLRAYCYALPAAAGHTTHMPILGNRVAPPGRPATSVSVLNPRQQLKKCVRSTPAKETKKTAFFSKLLSRKGD